MTKEFLKIEHKKNELNSKLNNLKDDKLKDNKEKEKEKEIYEKQINELQIEQDKIINFKEKRKEVLENITNNKKEFISGKNIRFILITIENLQKELDGFFISKEKMNICD